MRRFILFALGALLALDAHAVDAQETKVEVSSATPTATAQDAPAATVATPASSAPMPGQPAAEAGQPGQAQPGQAQPGQAQPGQAQPGQSPAAGAAQPAAPGVTTRPEKPPQPADPKELEVAPDEQGLVQFSFQGQSWPDVLEWYARVSGRALDWQELPGDYLNLTVRRKYSLDEARDLLNRHLLARGFTLIEHREGFSVVKTDKLNPAMVPRVTPDDLASRQPHEFVKVLFELDWLLADEAVKEFEALKSSNGKLLALPGTNRLEAMDAVANLREIHRVLQEEQTGAGRERLVREFPLQHVRATDVQSQLETFLGLERKSSAMSMPQGMDPQQMAMLQQQQMQMQQQMQAQMAQQQAQGGQPGAASRPKGEVRLVSDMRRNTLIAHAPPDKMAIIESFVETIDVPTGGADSLDAYLNRMHVFRLASLDAQQFVKSLTEMNVLAPTTRVQPDTKNNAVLVDGSLADQFTIKSLIEKLDGSGRRFEVITLRKHAADEVAGSIEFLMGSGGQEDDQQRNRRSYYGFYDFNPFGYGGRDESQRGRDKFRVGANLEYNQLLLWANDIELEEVEKLLVKLGEMPGQDGGSRLRRIEVPYGTDPSEFLRRLEQAWPGIAPNPLVLPDAASLPQRSGRAVEGDRPSTDRSRDLKTNDKNLSHPGTGTPALPPTLKDTQAPAVDDPFFTQAAAAAAADDDAPADAPAADAYVVGDADDDAGARPTAGAVAEAGDMARDSRSAEPARPTSAAELSGEVPRGTVDERLQGASHAPQPRSAMPRRRIDSGSDFGPRTASGMGDAPPVRISVGPNGDLILSSEDPRALNALEDWLASAAAPQRAYELFRLQYAPAYWVKLNLEEFFGVDEDDNEMDSLTQMWFGIPPSPRTAEKRQLGNRRKLRFIDDLDTNTIVVQGADRSQLKTIAELIELYDVPEPVNAQNARVTKIFQIKHSRASIIAETIKDAYRDLLSSNDKSLQNQQQNQNSRPEATIIRNYGPQLPSDNKEEEKKTQITFKGKLSIGIDDVTNTLLVSTEGEALMTIIGNVIQELDRAAVPQAHVEIVQLRSEMSAERMGQLLSSLLGDKARQVPPQAVQPPATPAATSPPPQPAAATQPVIIDE